MKKILLIVAVGLLFFSLASADITIGDPAEEEDDIINLLMPDPPPFFNNTGGVNYSQFADIWLTAEGNMDNVPDLYSTLNTQYYRLDTTNNPLTGDVLIAKPTSTIDINFTTDSDSGILRYWDMFDAIGIYDAILLVVENLVVFGNISTASNLTVSQNVDVGGNASADFFMGNIHVDDSEEATWGGTPASPDFKITSDGSRGNLFGESIYADTTDFVGTHGTTPDGQLGFVYTTIDTTSAKPPTYDYKIFYYHPGITAEDSISTLRYEAQQGKDLHTYAISSQATTRFDTNSKITASYRAVVDSFAGVTITKPKNYVGYYFAPLVGSATDHYPNATVDMYGLYVGDEPTGYGSNLTYYLAYGKDGHFHGNDDGGNYNFLWEGNANPNLFFINGSANKVSIGGDLNVTGDIINDAIYAQLSDLNDQSFGAVDTEQAINLTTTDEINGLSVSITDITISTAGVYSIFAQPQVAASAGQSGVFHMWLEKFDTEQWDDVPNSNVELSLASQEEDVIPLIVAIKLGVNEKIRVMGSVSNTGLILDTQSPAGEPVIPSIIFTMYRIGT